MTVDEGTTSPTERSIYRRVLRRELHSSRAGGAIAVALLLGLAGLAAGAGAAWLLVDPDTRHLVAEALRGLTAERLAAPVVLGAGIVAGLLGLWLVLLAVLPGRRARHARFDGRTAVFADDGVIADIVVDRVAKALGIERGRIRATVAQRSTKVVVTPTSGVAVNRSAASGAAEAASADLGTPLAPQIIVAAQGVIA